MRLMSGEVCESSWAPTYPEMRTVRGVVTRSMGDGALEFTLQHGSGIGNEGGRSMACMLDLGQEV